MVSPIDDVKPVEHTNANVLCIFKPGNPNTTYVYWTKSGYSGVRGYGKTLVLNYISKTDSGTYSCIAENNYYSGGKGNDSQSFTIDVLCMQSPTIMKYFAFNLSFPTNCSFVYKCTLNRAWLLFKMDPHLVLVKH